jgi:hypothetical protein
MLRAYRALLMEARRLGQHRTDEAAIRAALAEYVRRRLEWRALAAAGPRDLEEDD